MFAIKFSAGKLSSKKSNNDNIITLEYRAKVDMDKFLINADKIILNEGAIKEFRAFNNVYIYGKENGDEVKCNSFYYNESSKQMKAQGAVELTQKKDDILLRCEYFEDQGAGIIVIRGSIRLMKGDIFIRSDSAIYDKRNEMMQFIGQSSVIKNGEKLSGDKILYNLGSDEVEVLGRVNGDKAEF